MKKIIFLSILLSCSRIFSQSPAPPLINYQGVARTATGTPIVNQNIAIKFELIQGSPTNSVSYTDIHPSVPTNSLGLFSTQIGKINSLVGFIWQNGPYFLQVSIDPNGGTSYTPLGQPQQLVSVPYALYAEKSGNGALPTATLNGTTLRYNSIGSNWVIDTNLVNNGNRVWIGNRLNIQKNKFTSITTNSIDSSAVFGFHNAAQANYAGVRGLAAGASAPTGTNSSIGIFGGHFVGYNLSGTGIGVLGQGASASSNGIGLMGVGSSSGTAANNNFAVGLFATVDASATATNKFAGIFERGAVLINDSLFLGTTTNPGSSGNVLTRTSTGRAIWQPASLGSGPFTNSAGYIHAVSSVTNNRIILGIPFSGSVGYQSRVTVVNTTSNPSDTALSVFQKNASKPAFYSESNGTGFAIQAKNTGSNVGIYATTNAASSSTAPAIYGETLGNSTNNAGIYGNGGAFATGVKGFAGSFTGVWGESNGGTGVFGLSTQSGRAGLFQLTGNNTSSFPAVEINTNSDIEALKVITFAKGASIRAINSSTIAGSNNQALLIENGHIKATSTSSLLSPTTLSTSTFPALGTTAYTITNNSDVRGTIIIDNPSWTGISPGTFLEISVPFKKMYSGSTTSVFITPVILGPNTDKFSYFVTGQSNTNFTIRIKNNTAGTITPAASDIIVINYFVIE